MTALAIHPRHNTEHWNPGNLHPADCAACAKWLETVETREDVTDADATLARLLWLSLAVVLAVPGLFLTALWLTNLGEVRIWHLAGPSLLIVAGYTAAVTLTKEKN